MDDSMDDFLRNDGGGPTPVLRHKDKKRRIIPKYGKSDIFHIK